ncbi:hypothetical protein BH09BAC1_BH09BAC1_15870 [soil metagenome]
MPRLIIILDLDGVLITTPPWKADEIHTDGYSVFNQRCVDCFNELLTGLDAEVWVISTRRKGKTLHELQTIFQARGIHAPIAGLVPVYDDDMNRKDEALRFIRENNLQHYLIIDDNTLLNRLPREMKKRLVVTKYLLGFNEEKLAETREILGN